MAAEPRGRLRFSPRSIVLAVAMLGGTLTLLEVLAASRRVIGWIIVATTVAALLHPTITFLERRMRRGLAVLVALIVLGAAGGSIVYGVIDDVRIETERLQQVAPERARQIEESPRFGKLARDFKLEERTRRFVDGVPERLRGGTPAEALRAAGTRTVAFLATTVLTIFFLLHGPRIARSALAQVPDDGRRARVREVAVAVYRRSVGYASATLAMAIAGGLFGWMLAQLADVPGAAPLGIWVGLWDLVPSVGAFVGALPIVALAAAVSAQRAGWLIAAFVAYQLVENRLVQRPVEQATIRVGPFLTLVGGLVGLELSGVAGALVLTLAVVVVVVTADEVQRRRGSAGVASGPAEQPKAPQEGPQPESQSNEEPGTTQEEVQ